VVGFYLLNLGFVTLTMRTSGEIASARQAIQVLSVKIGEVLLVLGALYLANLGFLTRFRRRIQTQAFQRESPLRDGPDQDLPQPRKPEAARPETPGLETPAPAEPGTAPAHAQAAQASPARSWDQGLWRPRPRQALH
jgi:hypothetical protein